METLQDQTRQKIDVTDIDAVQPEVVEPEVDEGPKIPFHLQRHECGLWNVFVKDLSLQGEEGLVNLSAKKEIVRYLMDHGISGKERGDQHITDQERRYYEQYTAVQRKDRVSKQHFVAALRLSHHGYELWPQRSKNLNDMKVN